MPLGGVSINANGGSFECGVKSEKRTILDILRIRDELQWARGRGDAGDATPVSMRAIAKGARVDGKTALKYCDMYDEDPAELSAYMVSGGTRGPCEDSSPVIDEVGMAVLLLVYSLDPSTSLLRYRQELSAAGISASESTISKVLLSCGMNRGMPDLHPFDSPPLRQVVRRQPHSARGLPVVHQDH